MPVAPPRPGAVEDFAELAREYRSTHQAELLWCAPDGSLAQGCPPPAGAEDEARHVRAWAIAESLRWGEPTFHLAPGGALLWAVPLMYNAALTGGLVAWVPEAIAFGSPRPDLPRAATDLRRLAEAHNLTNAALLEDHRQEGGRQQVLAEAIHEAKNRPGDSLRRIYLLEEPALVSAIRRGDRGPAREVLNRVLVAIHHAAGDRLERVKGLYLELMVTVARTAVEVGGAPESLLESCLAAAARLASIEDEVALTAWLRASLDAALEAVETARRRNSQAQLAAAMRYLQEHFAEHVSRDEVAAVAHLSPAHFSRLVRRTYGRTFTQLVTRLRVDRAADLLRQTRRPIALIALETGFADASYLTKVFRRERGLTPAAYRRQADET